MKGVNFVTDDKNRRTAVIIDLKTIEQHQEEVEDLLDVIVAESRKGEQTRSWDEVKKSLQNKGRSAPVPSHKARQQTGARL